MNVLIIDIDSLRADHLGCYGCDRGTSPTIDELADEGIVFDNCYASDTPCLPSRTALATCRFGANSGVVTHYGDGQWYAHPGIGHDPDYDRPLSFRLLAEEGVHTASVSSFSQRHLAYHFSGSFQETIQPTATAGTTATEDCNDVTPIATDWIRRHADRDDWLLHVNYWDVHHPYDGIDEFVDPVRSSGPAPDWPDESALEEHRRTTGPRSATQWPTADAYDRSTGTDDLLDHGEWGMPVEFDDRAAVEHLVDGYDASIRKVDAEVTTLLEALEDAGIREETAVVVTADHGEALGEHGVYAEHALPHPPCQQVPMIISWPGETDEAAGCHVDEQVYQFDLMPTVCDLFDVPVPSGWDARSFAPALRGDAFDGRETIVSGHGIYTFGRAVYRGKWMYARFLHPGVFHYPGMYNDPDLPDGGRELLHDLDADPHMTTNLVEDRPEKAAELRSELDAWITDRVSDGWAERRPPSSRGTEPLATMTSWGPYLYVDPEATLVAYREGDWSENQVAAVERSLREYPRDRPPK
ncbi:sulfatase family protein [Halosolutus gelatinilyticus]|uniref:sulfatase family protein n=1 Tax=Halosolutus gelatinilyticus TaxID=2931975 RepID=UPI001FF67ACE|nr:sulfatase [Halosolutus gelatinilyticus]